MTNFTLTTDTLSESEAIIAQAWKSGNTEVDENLRKQAVDNVTAIIVSDFELPEVRQSIMKPLEDFGKSEMLRSAGRNKMLRKRIEDLALGGADAGEVGNNLTKLHTEIKNLDPGPLNFATKGVLGKFVNPMKKYFAKYKKADAAITDIIKLLENGAKVLKNDNATLLSEEQQLLLITKKLQKDVEMGRMMDEALEYQIDKAEAEGGDPDKIRFIKEEILFPLRQRLMDIHQIIIVNQQGIISMNVVQRNNRELINGVERAKNVTVTALRTAVTVAGALNNQKMMIEKIQTLNETTENVITTTSRILREQGAEIQQQAMEAIVSPDTLKVAFADALAALEDISNFKEAALSEMKRTFDDFREMSEEGNRAMHRLERGSDLALQMAG